MVAIAEASATTFSFERWWQKRAGSALKLAGVYLPLLSTALSVAASLRFQLRLPAETAVESTLPWVCLLQALTIASMAWRLPQGATFGDLVKAHAPGGPLPPAQGGQGIIPGSLLQVVEEDVIAFRDRFRVLLLVWMGLYFILTYAHFVFPQNTMGHAAWAHTLLNTANNASAFFIVWCYITLGGHREVPPPGRVSLAQVTVREPEKERTSQAVVGVVFAIAANWLFTAVATQTSLVNQDRLEEGARLFAFASGCICGVAHALLAGRLSNKALGVSPVGVAWVYLYAIIQPAFAYFLDRPWFEFVAITASLVLKAWLFLLVSSLLESGSLHFYLVRLRETDAGIDRERAEFAARVESSLAP